MARLKVFISSTYYDLKHIRANMETFVEDMGYEPVLSEKGSIAYNPSLPLDESCYRDAQACDILVLIIGGRYGSAASSEKVKSTEFFERYDSITKKEFQSAIDKDIPVYILIEKMVYGEYETFKRNRANTNINYAHVQNVNVFYLIEEILAKPKNNAVFHFEKHSEIIGWLKLQWSGLFKDFLQRRNEVKQISNLSEQVKYLSELNTTLKVYLEEMLTSSDKKDGRKLVAAEKKRLEEIEADAKLNEIELIKSLFYQDGIDLSKVKEMILSSVSLDDFVKKMVAKSKRKSRATAEEVTEHWKSTLKWPGQVNLAREILGLPELKFE